MAIRVPRIMHAKQILRHSKLFANQAASDSTVVPKGYIAVYVGESQKKRFIVPISFLNQPSFQKLLTIGSSPENIKISFQPKPAILLAFLWKVTINIFPRKIGLSLLMPNGLEQTMKVSFVWYDGQSLGTACEDIGGKVWSIHCKACCNAGHIMRLCPYHVDCSMLPQWKLKKLKFVEMAFQNRIGLVVTRATSTSYQGVLHVYFTRLCPANAN
ncbi:hypothetical protein Goshw_003566 [Gossypium schwendimanii]|uniref:Uncharacterized protein n=1 Tax=Gossypium schwendimanii TaxID=34291 RepID=A0A7J9KJ91_GOSSC|nr:hypothetical protein [Gossypium schwendimanii]